MNFGQTIREARQKQGYSLRDLARLTKLDYTYISKVENEASEYPPSEEVIRVLAVRLGLDAEHLIYMAGRITSEDSKILSELAKTYQKQLPILLKAIASKPELIQQLLEGE